MTSILSGQTVTLIGGDRRHDYLAHRLAQAGNQVRLVRRRPPVTGTIHHALTLDEGLNGAGVLVCPMSPFGEGGRVWSEDPEDLIRLDPASLRHLSEPRLVFAGSFPIELGTTVRLAGCEPVAMADTDELAILNSIPSAEGALQMALERTTVTVHGSTAVVLGYGRTGQTMARVLGALGARVRVIARRNGVRARAVADGHTAYSFDGLHTALAGARFAFNTVPASVLSRDDMRKLVAPAVIIDLASAPGGVDFEGARDLGHQAVLAPALPGRVAPETAAGYLGEFIERSVLDRLGSGSPGKGEIT